MLAFRGEDAKLLACNAIKQLITQQEEIRANNAVSTEIRKEHRVDGAKQAVAFKNYFKKNQCRNEQGVLFRN